MNRRQKKKGLLLVDKRKEKKVVKEVKEKKVVEEVKVEKEENEVKEDDKQYFLNKLCMSPAFVGLFYLSAKHIKFTYLIKEIK